MLKGQKMYSQGHEPLDKKTSIRNNPKGWKKNEPGPMS